MNPIRAISTLLSFLLLVTEGFLIVFVKDPIIPLIVCGILMIPCAIINWYFFLKKH